MGANTPARPLDERPLVTTPGSVADEGRFPGALNSSERWFLASGAYWAAALLPETFSDDVSTATNADAGMLLSSSSSPLGQRLSAVALEVPRRAVVGEHQPVALHRPQHGLGVGPVGRRSGTTP